MQKDPWWIRHKTIGLIVGMFFFAIFGFLEQTWMYFKGFDHDPIKGGYVHRKTGERRNAV